MIAQESAEGIVGCAVGNVVVDLDLEKFLYAASYCPPTHEE